MTKLETINAEDLQNRTYEPTHFLVDELIPEGLHILAGAPKIGKSWLALWLCLCVAQGQPLWNFATTQGEVLYLGLEDSFQRIQTRLFDLTEDAPPTLHFAIMADTLKHGLEQQIEQFLTEHPTTKLVVIDTLQRVRGTGSDSNLYANDYQDIGLLKQLADKKHIAILLIHHLRKLHDDDPMNMISGSTGLSGAADFSELFAINANSKQKSGAWAFLSYLLTQPCQEEMHLRLPVNDSVLQAQLAGLLEKETITQHEIDMFYQMVDGLQAADYPTATVEQIIREELAPYLAGEAEEETAWKIQSRVQLMLAEQFD